MDLRMSLSLLVLAGSIGVITAVPIDCSVIRCGLPPNCNPEDVFTPPGQCCAICRPDCSTVRCAKPQCKEGELIETPPGECCPVCTRPDCAAVLCLALTDQNCDDGEVLVTPPGECCARCQRDCSAVSCLRPVCEKGDMLKVPEGECCLVCVKEEVQCEIEGQVFSNCASPCPTTCDSDPNQICITLCVQGCTCPPGQVIDTVNNICVTTDMCPPIGVDCSAVSCLRPVCEKGEILEVPEGECCPICVLGVDCSAVSCLRPVCEKGEILEVPEGECCPICVLGVDCSAVLCLRPVCEEGETIEVPEGECCPICAKKACKLRCPPGHRCEVDNGETFCKPDCELDNGGCSSDQICSLVPVVCVQAPCPTKTVQCSCPPECSRDYCTANRKGLCSNPAYNDTLPQPGCTGSCRLTYCSACVFGVENPTIPSCEECPDYSSPNKCYEKWSQCIGRRFQDQVTSDAVFCASPPCFRRG